MRDTTLFTIIAYIPKTHCKKVKQAMFNTGAGIHVNYDQCCWQTKGIGQFRPLESSSPNIRE